METLATNKKPATAFPQNPPAQSIYGRGAPGVQPVAAPARPMPQSQPSPLDGIFAPKAQQAAPSPAQAEAETPRQAPGFGMTAATARPTNPTSGLGASTTATAFGAPAAPAARKPLTTADVLDKTSPSVGAVWRGTSEDVSAAASKGEYGRAIGLGIRGGLGLLPAAIVDTAAAPASSAVQGVRGFVGGLVGETAEDTPATVTPTPAQATHSNEGRNYPTQASTAGSPIRATGAPSKATSVALGQGRDVGFGVTRFDAPGQSPLFTNMTDAAGMASNQALMNRGAPSPQNQAAMDALLERGANERAAQRAQQQFAAEAAQAQAGNATGLGMARELDGRLQAERQARTASMDMRQKMNESPQAYDVRMRAMQEAQRLAAAQGNATADRGFNREKFAAEQQAAQSRLGLDQQRLGIERQRMGNELATGQVSREEKGLGIRSAKQVADIQARYMASTDSKEKAQLAQALRELSGKSVQADWGVQVTPATKNADGTTTPGSVYRFNKATGEVQQVAGGAGGTPSGLEPGQRYELGQTLTRNDGAKARVIGFDGEGKPLLKPL